MPSTPSLPTAGTWQRLGMPSAGCLPSAVPWALGKGALCRVTVFGHSAKPEALGNYEFSDSELVLINVHSVRVHTMVQTNRDPYSSISKGNIA